VSIIFRHFRPSLDIVNNQDFSLVSNYSWHDETFLMGVVADGCGSQKHSEVGAKLGASLTISALHNAISWESGLLASNPPWRYVSAQVLNGIANIQQMTNVKGDPTSYSKSILEYSLFTLIGYLITKETTYIFGLGDGVYSINGVTCELGPFEGNAPPYLAYSLFSDPDKPNPYQIKVHETIATPELDALLIGSDGVADFISAEGQCFPGKQSVVEPVSQLWEKDIYYKNSDAVRRYLSRMNKEALIPDWDKREMQRFPGLLPDDTTLVSVRRKACKDSE